MQKTKPFHRRKIVVIFLGCALILACLGGRLAHLMIVESEHYATLAENLHERERSIKAARGRILDRNGTVLADNRTVCTVSVIHSQIEEPERVIKLLSEELGLSASASRRSARSSACVRM